MTDTTNPRPIPAALVAMLDGIDEMGCRQSNLAGGIHESVLANAASCERCCNNLLRALLTHPAAQRWVLEDVVASLGSRTDAEAMVALRRFDTASKNVYDGAIDAPDAESVPATILSALVTALLGEEEAT